MTDAPSKNPTTEPPKPPETETVDVTQLQARIAELEASEEKWKGFSRKNEDEKKAVLAKLSEIEKAGMSETEKAIEDAKAAARKETLSEVGIDLAKAALAAAAATAKVEVPAGLSKHMNYSSLVGDDGKPNTDAISELVTSFKPAVPENPFDQNLGIGPQGTGTPPMRDMSPREIAKRARSYSPY